MTLIKTATLTSISTFIKMLVGFFVNKIVSVYAGPTGLALVGQLMSFNSIVITMANGAITQGVIKYTAEYKNDVEQKNRIFSSALVISIGCSLITCLLLFGFSSSLSQLILETNTFSSVFLVFGVTIPLFSLNTLFMAILNGQKEIKKYTLVNIASSIFLFFITSILVTNLGLIGALYSLVINQSIVFFVTVFFVIRSSWFKLSNFTVGIDKKSAKKLLKYSLMALSTALTLPLSHIIIRNYIGENINWESAGYWQAILYISNIYLLVITTSLGVYYLPRLSEIQTRKELKEEIISGYKVILPIAVLMALAIYLMREFVVGLAFTNEFLPMMNLFKWQLIGDVIKIASWILSYVLLAKAMTRAYIFTEILFNGSFVIISIIAINNFGLIGATYAFCINYILYFIVVLCVILNANIKFQPKADA